MSRWFFRSCRLHSTTFFKCILCLVIIYILNTILGVQYYIWSERSFENEYHLTMTQIDIRNIDENKPENILGLPKYIISNRFIINNEYLCNHGNSVTFIQPHLLILVKSAVENLKARQAIRMTWGKNEFLEKNNIKLAFVLGTNEQNFSVEKESQQYKDIIQIDKIDFYYHNSCYYGRPWSFNQRKTLFEYCLRFGLNTYVYAPKDDVKHRSRWRDLYSNEESSELNQLIHIAKRYGIKFIYALSPGLDIIYSSEKDLTALKRKFNQLSSLGCEHWAILFDDIESEMCQQDKDRFASFAHAQVAVANEIYDYLNKPNVLLFCPTQYCSRMAKPSVERSFYLQTIGNGLHPDIDIFWTGPKVISRRITISHILSVNNVLQRRVTIWDNLNANDYDQRRLYLGPFTGRSSNLSSRLSGMLTNPNCEFELNFIPLNTLGQWYHSLRINESQDQIDDNNNDDDDDDDDNNNNNNNNSLQITQIYQSNKALDQALIDWLPEFHKVKTAHDSQHILKIDSSPQAMSPKPTVSSLIIDEDSQDSICESQTSTTSSSKIHIMECDGNVNTSDITLDDIRLLVELFYLPYEHGPNAQQMFIDFYWLRFNYFQNEKLNEWRCRALSFHNNVKNVGRLVQRLTTIHNRSLLYDIYNYVTDISSTISLCSRYLHWIDNDHKHSSIFLSGDVEPASRRGGLAGEFLNILPMGDFQSIIKPELNSLPNIYLIQPMTSNDQASMYALCTQVCYRDEIDDLLEQHSEILADKLIGGYLLSSLNNFDLCFVVNNVEDELCAFVLTIIESEKYDKLIQPTWITQLHQKYPNVDQNFFEINECYQWIYDRYSVRIQLFIDLTIKTDNAYFIGNKLIKIIIDNLIKRGYQGCHALLDERNPLLHQYYLRLGFVDIPNMEQNDHIILVGKQF
ncbi:unnamed protein product [Rotaria sp. Silwood1]|nr:unnamed protein product [Rotaria sp. Silwood1]